MESFDKMRGNLYDTLGIPLQFQDYFYEKLAEDAELPSLRHPGEGASSGEVELWHGLCESVQDYVSRAEEAQSAAATAFNRLEEAAEAMKSAMTYLNEAEYRALNMLEHYDEVMAQAGELRKLWN